MITKIEYNYFANYQNKFKYKKKIFIASAVKIN